MERHIIYYKNKTFLMLLFLAAPLAAIYFAALYFYAKYTHLSDFPVFYNAARFALHSNQELVDIYKGLISNEYPVPERVGEGKFIYSLAALLIMSPLGYLDYYTSKATLMFAGTISYILGVHIILKQLGLQGRWHVYPLALASISTPFFVDIAFAQINSILFFFVVLAIYSFNSGKTIASGSLLGFAAIFKLFPIGFAFIFGLRDWRVLGAGLLVFGSSFLMPGSMEWFRAMQSIAPSAISPAFSILAPKGIVLFISYSVLIMAVTTGLIYFSRETDPLKIGSYLAPSIFLAAPVYEYYHLVFLTLPYLYLVGQLKLKLSVQYISVLVISISLVTFEFYATRMEMARFSGMTYLSLLLLWGIFSHLMLKTYINKPKETLIN